MDSKRITQIQKDFSTIHLMSGVIATLYLMIRYFCGFQKELFTFISISLILSIVIIDFLFGRYDYFSSVHIVFWIRWIEMGSCSVYLVYGSYKGLISHMACLLYTILIMEISYIYHYDSFKENKNVLGYMQLPLAFFVVTGIFLGEFDLEQKIGLLFWLLFSIVISTQISYRIYKEVFGNFVSLGYQRRMTLEAQKKNLRMLSSQIEMKKTNDDLLIKQEELEDAYKKINQVNSEIVVQNLIQRYISTSLKLENLLSMITESITEALAITCCGILVCQEDGEKQWEVSAYSVLGEKATKEFQNQILDKEFLERFGNLNQKYIDNKMDYERYPLLINVKPGSLLIFPLKYNGRSNGLLIIEKDRADYFGSNIAFFESVATQLVIALKNAQLYKKMEDMAMKDGLTGIYNRAYLNKKIAEIGQRMDVKNENMVVVLFDIDDFKRINDRYGHIFGDTVIKFCAIIAKALANDNGGIVARYGGEEFVILLRNKKKEEISEIIKELHRKISTKLLESKQEKVKINISGGVAIYPDTCKKQNDLLNHADWAMYYSKENGKGYTTFDSEKVRKIMRRM